MLDEDDHLVLLNSARSIFVEGSEDLCEGFFREFITRSEVSKSVLNKFLGLFFVESSRVVNVVDCPDLVDDTSDSLFFR